MSKELLQILLAMTFAAPLLAAVVMVVLPRSQWRRLTYRPGIAGALLSVFAGLVAVFVMRDSGLLFDEPLHVYRWITLSDGLSISFRWQLDSPSALFVVITGLATCFALIAVAQFDNGDALPRRSPVVGASLLQCSVVLLFLAADWFTFYWSWVLMSVTSGILVVWTSRSDTGEPRAAQQLLPIWIANGVVLCGLPIYWNAFATFDFHAVDAVAGIAGTSVESAPWPVWAFGFCLLAGVAARCALFPLAIDWTASKKCAGIVALEPALLLPAGLYLAARGLMPLSATPLSGVLVMSVGAMTALIGSVDAAVQPDLPRRLKAVGVSLCGMTVLGLGTMSSVGCTAALCLAAVQTAALSGAWLAASSAVKQGGTATWTRWAFAANGVVLCSGIWGQHAILAAVAATTEQLTEPWVGDVVYAANWVAMASLPCLSYALVAAFCSLQSDEERQPAGESRWWLWMSPLAAAAVAPALILLPAPLDVVSALHLDGVARVGFASLPLIDIGLPLVLLGAVAAWLQKSNSQTDRPQLTQGLLHWLQTGCGIPQFWSFVVGFPIRVAAGMCRVIDAVVLTPTLNLVPHVLSQVPARVAGILQAGQVQFYALSALLATALLLLVLMGMGS